MQSAYSEAEMQRCQIQAQVAKAKEPMGRATRTLARTAESADRFSDTSLVIAKMVSRARHAQMLLRHLPHRRRRHRRLWQNNL